MTAADSIHRSADPTLAVAERQLAMLGEVAQISMELSRAHGASALAAAHAVEVILADEYWQPETGRARALAGSRDAAEAFQKVSRSLRLTLALEMTTAETVRDLQNGVITKSHARAQGAGGTPADQDSLQVRRRLPGSCSEDATTDYDMPERNFERLYEFDRPDRLPRGAFRDVVDILCAEIGVSADREQSSVRRPELRYRPLQPRPPGWSEARPPGSMPPKGSDTPDHATEPLLESVTPPQTPP